MKKNQSYVWLIMAVIAIVIIAVLMQQQNESYAYTQRISGNCDLFNPNIYGLRESSTYLNAVANVWACKNNEARGAHETCSGGQCGHNQVDFTGCSQFLPPDQKPSDVPWKDYQQAWSNYYACVENKPVNSRKTSGNCPLVVPPDTCTDVYNNMDFLDPNARGYQTKWSTRHDASNYDPNMEPPTNAHEPDGTGIYIWRRNHGY